MQQKFLIKDRFGLWSFKIGQLLSSQITEETNMNRITLSNWGKITLLAAAVILATMTAAYANGEIISACVNPAGQIRIIDYEDTCRPQETYLEWNAEGMEGPEGPAGPPGLSEVTVVAEWGPSNSDDSKTHMVWCPEGMTALSGGFNISGGGPNIVVRTFHPQTQPGDSAPTGWQVSAHEIEPTASAWSIRAVAVCAYVEE